MVAAATNSSSNIAAVDAVCLVLLLVGSRLSKTKEKSNHHKNRQKKRKKKEEKQREKKQASKRKKNKMQLGNNLVHMPAGLLLLNPSSILFYNPSAAVFFISIQNRIMITVRYYCERRKQDRDTEDVLHDRCRDESMQALSEIAFVDPSSYTCCCPLLVSRASLCSRASLSFAWFLSLSAGMKALSQLLFDTRPVAKRRRRGGCDIPTSAVHLEFLMHRVSSVWKESPRKEEGALGGGAITNWQQNLAKGNNNHHSNSKNDLQLLRYSWERSHKVWPAITMFLFVFTVCLIMIPELLDSVSLEARRSADLVAGSVQPGEQDSVRLMTGELSRSSVLDVAPEITHGAVRGVQGWAGTGLQDDVQKDILLPPSGADLNPLQLSAAIQIYVYELPRKFNEDWLVDKRCSNHLFAAEVAIHQNLLSSPLRTLNPDEADFFFLPVYVSCKFSPKTGFPSIGHAPRTIHSAVSLVSSAMPYWNRSKGSDHIFVATHDFGACFHSMEDMAMEQGIPGFMRNSIILQTFGETTWHPCQDVENIQIPPYISPLAIAPYMLPPEEQKRNIFAFFRGKMEIHPKNYSGRMYSRGVRTAIYHRYGRNKLFYLKRQRAEGYQAELLRSIFCLCPLGWAPWSPRIVESVVFGCVPVIIADNIALPYSHAVDWNAISLKVREIDVPRLAKILLHVAATNLSVIQKNLWKEENRQALLFLEPLRIGDATWHLLDLLSRKIGRSHATRSPRALFNTEI